MKTTRKAKRHTKPESRRQVQIALLNEILRFAFSDAPPETLVDEAKALYSRMALWGTVTWPWEAPELMKRAQGSLRGNLIGLANSPDWAWELPPIGREVTKIGIAYHSCPDGRCDEAFLHAAADQLCGPEGWRLKVCAVSECATLLIQNRQGRYCDAHADIRARQARYRKSLCAKEKSARRRKYYLNHLKKHDPDRWKHLVRRERGKK